MFIEYHKQMLPDEKKSKYIKAHLFNHPLLNNSAWFRFLKL